MSEELRYYVLPHPIREGRLLVHDLAQTLRVLDGVALGRVRRRLVLYPRGDSGGGDSSAEVGDAGTASDEPGNRAGGEQRSVQSRLELTSASEFSPPSEQDIRRAEFRLQRHWLGRSRQAGARALLWRLLGVSLALLWINTAWILGSVLGFIPVFGPPLDAFTSSLGSVAGGPVLATVVGLLPLWWAWGRSGPPARDARRYRNAVRVLGSRRFAAVGLEFMASPEGAAFAGEASPVIRQLRQLVQDIPERGSIAAGDLARGCRTLFRLARETRWEGAAPALYALYTRFDVLEQRLTALERKAADGVLAARRVRRDAERALRAAAARLAPYVVPEVAVAGERQPRPAAGRVPTYAFRPVLAWAMGLTVLIATVWMTGLYYVADETAVVIDPVEARVARLAGAIGDAGPWSELPLFGDIRRQDLPVDTAVELGFHWTLPRPFAARHAVSLEPQLLPVQAVFRQVGPNTVEVVQVVVVFQIVDVRRWARRDRLGDGVAQLSEDLSSLLQTVLQSQRRALRLQIIQQEPQLAGDEAEVLRRADSFLAQRMEDVVSAFVQSIGRSSLPSEAGIRFGSEFRLQVVPRLGTASAIE